jgi:hypothetical protein
MRELHNDPEGKFYRRGGCGGWRDELPAAILDIFRSEEPYPTLFGELGYTLDPRDPLIDAPAKPRVSTNPFLKEREFDNGVKVPTVVIKCYLSLDPKLKARWSGNVTATLEDSFFAWLNAPADRDPKRQDPVSSITNLAHYIYCTRQDLQRLFPDLFGKDQGAYMIWFIRNAASKYNLDQVFTVSVQRGLVVWSEMLADKDRSKTGAMPVLTNLAMAIYRMRPDLQAAFPDVFERDRTRFARWFVEYAQAEYASDKMLTGLVRSSERIISQTLPRGASVIRSLVFSLRRKLLFLVKRASFWNSEGR